MVILIDTEENREEPRTDKGKGKALDNPETGLARALKRKRSSEQDNVPGPSKKQIFVPKVEEGDGKGGCTTGVWVFGGEVDGGVEIGDLVGHEGLAEHLILDSMHKRSHFYIRQHVYQLVDWPLWGQRH